MDAALPLDKMSVEEKLRALDLLWGDFTQTPAALPSPDWHQDVPDARERRLREGKETFIPWDEARQGGDRGGVAYLALPIPSPRTLAPRVHLCERSALDEIHEVIRVFAGLPGASWIEMMFGGVIPAAIRASMRNRRRRR